MIRYILLFLHLSLSLFSINFTLFPEHPVPGSVLVISRPETEYIRGCSLFKNEELVYDAYPVLQRDGGSVYIIPLSHTVAPGEYTVRLYYANGSIVSQDFQIYEREFIRMDIPLNQGMSDLRSTSSRLKTLESKELWKILGTRNNSIVFRKLEMNKPVTAERITSYYGDRRTYIYSDESQASTYHNGIDYAVPVGTPVTAAESGVVVLAKKRIITGFTVVLEHGPGIFTLYYHLDSLDVQKDDIVLKDDQIGLSGATGLATGPHLHFEMRVFQVPVDPEQFFLSTRS